jgi:putative SOS response-associated peptidase YedK
MLRLGGSEDDDIQSCSIVTTDANELMRPLHDRLPVMLDPKDYAAWLDQRRRPKEELLSLLRPFPSEAMKAVPLTELGTKLHRA